MLMRKNIYEEIDSFCDRIAFFQDRHIVSLFNADDFNHKTEKTNIFTLVHKKVLT